MKMLNNSVRGLLSFYKQLLYRIYVLLITLYSFPLWYFKSTPLYHLLKCQDRWWWTSFFIFFSLYFIFLLLFLFFSIFRITWVRVYQLHCHISHKLMAQSQDWSQDLREWSRRFWNKVMSYNIDNTCWPHDIHMVIKGRVHSSEHGP